MGSSFHVRWTALCGALIKPLTHLLMYLMAGFQIFIMLDLNGIYLFDSFQHHVLMGVYFVMWKTP